MFVPLILICSAELGCTTVPGPMSTDQSACHLYIESWSLDLGPRLPNGYAIYGLHCLEWVSGEVV